MRDIKRIEPILERIKEVWMSKPDTRFGQLMYCMMRELEIKYGVKDVFYLEDEVWVDLLEEKLKDNNK